MLGVGGIHNALVTYSLYFCLCISVFYHYCIFKSVLHLCVCESCSICISWQVELERGGEVWMLKSGEWGGGYTAIH